MVCLDEHSTCAARSFTASATTPKPRPASTARLASTLALKATRRVCMAICVFFPAAADTWRSVSTMPLTSAPMACTASPTWPTARRPRCVSSAMPAFARITSCSCRINACTALACSLTVLWLSSSTPRTSAASRPSVEAVLLMDATNCCSSLGAVYAKFKAGACDAGGRLKAANMAGAYHSRSRVRSLAMLWLWSWQTRLSVTPSTAAISFRFMSCS